MKKNLYCYLIGFILCLSCQSGSKAPVNNQDKKQLTVSIEPLRYITEQIAGKHFQVHTLVPKGSSPETYEPTPQQMMDLSKSEAYLSIGGLGFEQTWLKKLQQTAPEVLFAETSQGIKRIGNHAHASDVGTHYGTDPHVWTSPRNMKVIARNICAIMCDLDPQNQNTYQENLQKSLTHLQAVDDSISHLLKSVPQRDFLIYHPTLTYFAQDYQLNQIAIESDGKEPSPIQLIQLIQTCKQKKIGIIFIQQEFDRKNAQLIAKETQTRIIDINPLSYNWDEEMLKIAQTLQAQ